jgi:beta-glucosidase
MLRLVLLSTAAAAASAALPTAPGLCAGEWSTCSNGVCALVASQCNQCAPGRYACPFSSSCFDGAAGFSTCPGLKGTHFDSSLSIEQRLDFIFSSNWSVEDYVGQMTENATAVPRLFIPAYNYLSDDQHGVKQPDATAFPNGCSLGATWDGELLTQVGLAIGVEARGTHNSLQDKSAETGGHSWPGTLINGAGLTLYAPNVNLVHDPRWGRANEVMSECPHLTGSLVASYVTGLQNSTAETASTGPLLTVACCKHYAIYNGALFFAATCQGNLFSSLFLPSPLSL